jgi:hypothetical protein
VAEFASPGYGHAVRMEDGRPPQPIPEPLPPPSGPFLRRHRLGPAASDSGHGQYGCHRRPVNGYKRPSTSQRLQQQVTFDSWPIALIAWSIQKQIIAEPVSRSFTDGPLLGLGSNTNG